MTALTHPANDRLARILDLGVTLLAGCILAFRIYFGGQDPYELASGFIDVLAWFALFLWAARCVTLGEVRLAWTGGLLLVPLYVGAVLLAYGRSQTVNPMAAGMLLRHWASDFILFFLILHHCATRDRWRMLLTVFAGTAAVIALHAVYQRVYGLEYFQRAMAAQADMIDLTIGTGSAQRELFDIRLKSMRAYGTYGYSNALAGFLLLAVPLWIGQARERGGAALWVGRLLGGAGVLALVYSGSKAGFLSAKTGEWLYVALLAYRSGLCRRSALVLAGTLVLTMTLAGMMMGAVAWRFASWADWDGMLAAETTFACIWWFEILVLAERFSGKEPFCHRFRVLVGTVTLLFLFVVAWGAAGCPYGGERFAGYGAAVRAEAGKHFDVRWQYWVAGARMVMAAPIRGLGLDAYGHYYTHYKTPEGTAVRRAHNTYLQMAADGGVLLLGTWMAFWIWCLTRRRVVDLPPEPISPGESPAEVTAMYGKTALAIGASIYLVAMILFTGLSVEFVYAELLPSKISSWATNRWPGLIHLGAHLLLFPVLGIAAGWATWRWTESDGGMRLARRLLLAGCGMLMAHLMYDFHYHMQVISMLLWAFAAMTLAWALRPGDWRVFRFSAKSLTAVRVAVVVAFIWVGRAGPLDAWGWLAEYAGAEALFQTGDIEKAMERYERLSAEQPAWPDVHRRMVDCINHLAYRNLAVRIADETDPAVEAALREAFRNLSDVIRATALREVRLLLACEPEFAANHAFAARTLVRFFAHDPARLEEAYVCMQDAIRRHPLQAGYYHELADVALRLKRVDEARKHLREALRIDIIVADPQAKLRPEERRFAEQCLLEMAKTPPAKVPPPAP